MSAPVVQVDTRGAVALVHGFRCPLSPMFAFPQHRASSVKKIPFIAVHQHHAMRLGRHLRTQLMLRNGVFLH